VSEETAPERIAVIWSPEARADVRAIERVTAMQILRCVDRYLTTLNGDVKSSGRRRPVSGCVVATTGFSLISKARTPSRLPA
jgi:hypothetical protein